MSNEPGGSAPLPDPYTTPGGHETGRGPVPPPPSGYEAVLPPPAPYSTPAPGYQGAGSYAAVAQTQPGDRPTEDNPFAPPPAGGGSQSAAYGSQPAPSAYGQAPAYVPTPLHGQTPPFGAAAAY